MKAELPQEGVQQLNEPARRAYTALSRFYTDERKRVFLGSWDPIGIIVQAPGVKPIERKVFNFDRLDPGDRFETVEGGGFILYFRGRELSEARRAMGTTAMEQDFIRVIPGEKGLEIQLGVSRGRLTTTGKVLDSSDMTELSRRVPSDMDEDNLYKRLELFTWEQLVIRGQEPEEIAS